MKDKEILSQIEGDEKDMTINCNGILGQTLELKKALDKVCNN